MGLLSKGLLSQKAVSGKPTYMVDTNVYLYNLGDECSALTGDWKNGYLVGASSTYTESTASIDFVANGVYSNSAAITAVTTNKINLTNYSKLKMLYSGSLSHANSEIDLAVNTINTGYIDSGAVGISLVRGVNTFTDSVLEIDITSLNSDYYVGVQVYKSTLSSTSELASIKKVWLEV